MFKTVEDKRLREYKYLEQLKEYISHANIQYLDKDKQFIYPKQLEIHLPSNRINTCNLNCDHCFGTLYEKSLGTWEVEGLKLLNNLKGKIKNHIYGGAYTEPLLSPFLFSYLATTKHYNNSFGIHTNAVMLNKLQDIYNFFNNLNEISTDKVDYISISLDAGNGYSWVSLKKGHKKDFWNIISSIEDIANIRDKKNKNSHAIRIVYLASEKTAFQEEFEFIISMAKMFKIDSVRFSIPYGFYNQNFNTIKKYKIEMEDKLENKIEKYIENLISKSEDEKPYIFWNPPYWTDINRFNFNKCFYGLFQITMGADGFIYPCSAVASPSAKYLRKGKITSNLNKFQEQVYKIQKDEQINCKIDCFKNGLRCNRMGLEINEWFNKKENKT